PHSEIPGSQSTYDSPRHIGVSPVLHRLLVPRHSPYALLHLTSLHLKHVILSSDGSYQLANFLLLPTISQHQFATLIVFPLARNEGREINYVHHSRDDVDPPINRAQFVR